LTIAGIGFSIHSKLRSDRLEEARFKPFHAPKGGSIQVSVQRIDADDLTAAMPDPEIDPRLAQAGRRGISSKLLRSATVSRRLEAAKEHVRDLFIEMYPSKMTVIDFHSERVDSYFLCQKDRGLPRRWIGPALLAPFLPRFDALIIHASAIVRNDRAAVFLAPDEGGKTTAVRLAPSGTILGDDQVIVRRRRGKFHAWGTPWGLHMNAAAHAPLAGLFLLKKAKRFFLTPLPARSLVPFIWGEIKAPLAILPKPLKKKAFNILCDITAAVPAWTLAFPRNHIDWHEVDLALQGRMKNTRQREDRGCGTKG